MQLNQPINTSVILKLIVIGVLIIILLIPTFLVRSLIQEREQRRDSAVYEVSNKWGEQQTVVGPILAVPYKKFIERTEDGKKIVEEEITYAHFLPEKLNINGEINPKMLNRGIYDIVVYNGKLNFSGEFLSPNFKDLNIAESNVVWKDAVLSIAVSDMRGIRENIKINWDNQELQVSHGINLRFNINDSNKKLSTQPIKLSPFAMDPGLIPIQKTVPYELSSGVNTKLALNIPTFSEQKYNYSFDLNLNGSEGLDFVPLGSETNVELISSWSAPSFDGAFLPDQREISDKGFSAKWKILELNRNFSQSWLTAPEGLLNSSFGVKLLIPVDEYQKSMRSVKYAIMVIVLTFLIFFFVEVLNKIKIHPIQYLLVGAALVLFFVLLISLSEHISFNLSYLISSIAVLLMITLYSKHIFKHGWLTFLQGLILIAIYIFIFTIIQLQDYALLMGSIGLFIILAIVMSISRQVDWYGVGSKD